METWHPSLETFFIGYRFGGGFWGVQGRRKNNNFYVVNVHKKRMSKTN